MFSQLVADVAEALWQCTGLTALQLVVREAEVDVAPLLGALQQLPDLVDLELNVAFSRLPVVDRLLAWAKRIPRLRLSLSDVPDVTDVTLRRWCESGSGTAPSWTQLHLSLKHTSVGDAGLEHLMRMVAGCAALSHLHLNLAYTSVSTAGRSTVLQYLRRRIDLRHCQLKMDTDRVDVAGMACSVGDADRLESLRLSLAFTALRGLDLLHLGAPRLRRLVLDLYGCRSFAESGGERRLVAGLSCVAGTLRILSLGLGHTGLTDDQLLVLLRDGLRPLARLAACILALSHNELALPRCKPSPVTSRRVWSGWTWMCRSTRACERWI